MSPADVSFDRLANQFHSTEPVYVTRPRLPSLDDYVKHLRRVWDSHWLTNDGALHDELRAGLETYLVLTGSTQPQDLVRFPYRPSRIVESIADIVNLI